jgi:RNA polymerase sigma factor (sigma-70 family)
MSVSEEEKEKMLNEHKGLLHKFARRYLQAGKKVGYEYDDLLMIAAQGLLRALRDYDETKSKKSTYMSIWIVSYLQRAIEKAKKNDFIPFSSLESDEDDEFSNSLIDIIHYIDDEDVKDELEDALARADIPDRVKKMIKMYYVDGMTLREIANEFGISKEAIRMNMRKYLHKVYKVLNY